MIIITTNNSSNSTAVVCLLLPSSSLSDAMTSQLLGGRYAGTNTREDCYRPLVLPRSHNHHPSHSDTRFPPLVLLLCSISSTAAQQQNTYRYLTDAPKCLTIPYVYSTNGYEQKYIYLK